MFVDPGCVAYRTADDFKDSSLQVVYGTLAAPIEVPRKEAVRDSLATISPVKRSHAIQILRPDARKPSLSFPSMPALEVAPPTPVPMPFHQPYAIPESPCRSASPTSNFLIDRPHSRNSSVGSSSAASSLFSYKRQTHHRSNSSISVASVATSVSSQTSVITRPSSACSVTEHSNGKVGVLGGGVLLGLPSAASGSSSSEDSSETDEDFLVGVQVQGGQQGNKRRRNRQRGQRHNSASSSAASISRLHPAGAAHLFNQWAAPQAWSAPYKADTSVY
jgi:hypothetical protein